MPTLRVIDNEKMKGPAVGDPARIRDQVDDLEFGSPPNLLVGIFTGLLGVIAGILSLAIFFQFWRADPHTSPDWLIFVVLGAIAGYFMRIERLLYREAYRELS